jgi:hypothetical protein
MALLPRIIDFSLCRGAAFLFTSFIISITFSFHHQEAACSALASIQGYALERLVPFLDYMIRNLM